jgi:type VI secretion system protein
MSGRGLLSRIGVSGSAQSAPAADSVIEHLRVLLNTRRGESPAVPTYGVPDFSDVVHSFPGGIQTLQRAIRDTINEFEPRLKNVQVRHVPNEDDVLTLRFEITGRLADGNRLLKLQTRVLAGGHMKVD